MEDLFTEYKREYTEDLKYAVLAFANTDGGRIYVGINDDGSVCGVAQPDAVLLRITNMIRDAIKPDVTLFTSCAVREMGSRCVIVISVQRGTSRPYYLTGKGVRPEGVYVRQGSASVPASEAAILRMIKETAGDRYEEARSLEQRLTFQAAEAYFQKKRIPFEEQQMRTLHLIAPDGTYTNLALLLSDQCPHSVKLAVFEGTKKTVFRDRKDLSGSLFTQIEEAYAVIDRNNRTGSTFEGLDRIDRRDFPPEAIREALLNAVVHRDYSISGPVLISIFDDRIEFVSLGGLANGITFEDVILGVSVLRNQNLANVFYRLRLIEAYGTGMLKIKESYEGCAAQPVIEVSANAFKVTLPNVNQKKETARPALQPAVSEPGAEVVLELLKRQKKVTRRQVQEALCISQTAAGNLLRRLTRAGIVIRIGTGKSTVYRLP